MDAEAYRRDSPLRQAFLQQHPEEQLPRTWPAGQPCQPSFMVIGAPKSGSTSIFQYLQQHPQVRQPARKELCYFSEFKRHLQRYRPLLPSTHWDTYTAAFSGEKAMSFAQTEARRRQGLDESAQSAAKGSEARRLSDASSSEAELAAQFDAAAGIITASKRSDSGNEPDADVMASGGERRGGGRGSEWHREEPAGAVWWWRHALLCRALQAWSGRAVRPGADLGLLIMGASGTLLCDGQQALRHRALSRPRPPRPPTARARAMRAAPCDVRALRSPLSAVTTARRTRPPKAVHTKIVLSPRAQSQSSSRPSSVT